MRQFLKIIPAVSNVSNLDREHWIRLTPYGKKAFYFFPIRLCEKLGLKAIYDIRNHK